MRLSALVVFSVDSFDRRGIETESNTVRLESKRTEPVGDRSKGDSSSEAEMVRDEFFPK